MRARLVQLGDDDGDRLTDARNLGKPVLGDQGMKRDGKGRQAICGPRLGFCAVRIAAAQGAALRIFSKEARHGAGVEGWHSMSLPPHVLRSRWSDTTSSGRSGVGVPIERPLELLRCAEVLEVLHVRSVSGFFLEEIVNSPGHQLQMLHLAPRHRAGPAKSSAAWRGSSQKRLT